MSWLERFMDRLPLKVATRWGGTPSRAERDMRRRFAEDVSVFFAQIGIEDQVAIRKLPDDDREMGLAVDVHDLEWRFRQAWPTQSLTWRSPRYADVEIWAAFMPRYFNPPTEAEISELARLPGNWPGPETLAQIAAYVSKELGPILEALSGDAILIVAQRQREFFARLSEARRKAWSRPGPGLS